MFKVKLFFLIICSSSFAFCKQGIDTLFVCILRIVCLVAIYFLFHISQLSKLYSCLLCRVYSVLICLNYPVSLILRKKLWWRRKKHSRLFLKKNERTDIRTELTPEFDEFFQTIFNHPIRKLINSAVYYRALFNTW